MSATRPRIDHLDPGFRAICGGCGESLTTTRHTIANDWLRDHKCDLAVLRANRLKKGGAA